MPTGSIPIEIDFKIEKIYKWWTWPDPEKLMVFEIFYRFNKAATGFGDTIMIDQNPIISSRKIDWTFPITGQQSKTYIHTINVYYRTMTRHGCWFCPCCCYQSPFV